MHLEVTVSSYERCSSFVLSNQRVMRAVRSLRIWIKSCCDGVAVELLVRIGSRVSLTFESGRWSVSWFMLLS